MSELKYFDIAWLSRTDGPGMRTVLFLQGCHLRCPWCHSPHSWDRTTTLLHFGQRCSLCGECRRVCPSAVHGGGEGGSRLRSGFCCACGACIEACPASVPGDWGRSALGLTGRSERVERLYARLAPQLRMLRECGGLTVSGGEPLLQVEGVAALLRLCRADGIATALETSASLPRQTLTGLLELVDCWLIGLRPIDPAHRRGAIVAPIQAVRDTLAYLRQHAGGRMIVRYPVIPGFTDGEGTVREIVALMKDYALGEIELLPLHAQAGHYYAAMQLPFPLAGVSPPTAEKVQTLSGRFRQEGFGTRIVC